MRRRPRFGSGLIAGELSAPDTWEVALSSGADKRAAWERLLREQKLGALALLRNLRNLREAGAAEELVLAALGSMSTGRVLPFRFLAAARYAPQWEEALEQVMLKCVAGREKLAGKTIVLVDVSGSMTAPLSQRSEMQRTDAAYGLAVLLREIVREGGGLQLLRYAGGGAGAARLRPARCASTHRSATAARNSARLWRSLTASTRVID